MNDIKLEQLLPLLTEQLEMGKSVRFHPEGRSMLPMLRPAKDSVVLAAITEPIKKYDITLYRRDNGQFVLHRIVKIGATYTAVGDHHLNLEQGIRPDQMIAKVVSFTRNGKERSVSAFGYRVYCIFWYYTRPLRKILYHILTIIRRKK